MNPNRNAARLSFAAASLACLLAPALAGAATFTVTNTADAGAGSLRQAIADANAVGGADTIEITATGTIALTSGELVISDTVTMTGPGARTLVIDAGTLSRVLRIDGGSTDVTLSGLTLTRGRATGNGGAVLNNGRNLTVRATRIVGNEATGEGGAIYDPFGGENFLVIQNSEIAGNRANKNAAIFYIGFELRIDNSTIHGNTATDSVGGILVQGGFATIRNSTISDNTAQFVAGFQSQDSTVTFESSILANNIDITGVNDINRIGSGTVSATNSLFEENVTATSVINGTNTANLIGVDPQLLALADNGGPTNSMRPGPTSPAIGAGSNSQAYAFDQRGNGFARNEGGAVDIGAIQRALPPVAPNIAYAPDTGTTVGFTGVTTIGTTGNGTIVATPSGGSGTGAGATTTINTCTLGGASPAAFAGAAAINLSFVGDVTTAQNINLTCTSAAIAQAATLTCNETRGTAAPVQRQWPLNCPAGAPVAPTITYAPATGTDVGFTGVTTIGSTGSGTIAATPSGGIGTGAGATTTVNGCTVGGANAAAFSGAAAVSLSFIGNTTTAQNIALGCTSAATVQTATLSCNETRGAAAPVTRQWPLSCPAGTLLPLGSSPGVGSTVSVSGAGGLVLAQSIVLSNPNPIPVTVTCSAPTAPFTVSPVPLVVPANGSASLAIGLGAGPGMYSGSLSCTVAGSTQLLGYNLAGTIAQAQPVDATSGWSRALLLLMMLAAGLCAVALVRRP